MNGDACPVCGKGILTKKVIDEAFVYKKRKIVISEYVVYECSTCGEAIVDKETLKTSGEILKEHLLDG